VSILSGPLRCRPSGFGSIPSLLCESTRFLGGFSQGLKFLSDRFGDHTEPLGGLPVRLVCHAPEFGHRARRFGGLPVVVLLFTTSFGGFTRVLCNLEFVFRFLEVRGLLGTHTHSSWAKTSSR
jgi:hypothetical protein